MSVGCPICLEELMPNTVKITNCAHTFCGSCLDKWLLTNHTCPLCRQMILKPDDPTINRIPREYIYTYPIELEPNLTIPSGTVNFSRMMTFNWVLTATSANNLVSRN